MAPWRSYSPRSAVILSEAKDPGILWRSAPQDDGAGTLIDSAPAVDGTLSPRSPSAGLAGLPRPGARDAHRRAGPRLLLLGFSQEFLAVDGDPLHGACLAADAVPRRPHLARQPGGRAAQPPLRRVPPG